jgi:drug/metabolite transporter (DMT)-like permease
MPTLFRLPPAALALTSAALFGASTPLAKLLLGAGASPGLLAGLLYLGSGIGLSLFIALRALSGRRPTEAPLRRADWPWLALTVIAGGVIGPLLLMIGLSQALPATTSLLLNAESLFTMTIAWIVFREHVDRRLLLGAFAILAGAGILSWTPGSPAGGGGAVWVLGACLAWAIDNNLTRKLSSADPLQITAIKGLVAGAVNLAIALASGAALPGPAVLGGAAVVGFLGYGVSLALCVLSLRGLGAARTGAYFSTAPFLGALLSLALYHDPITAQLVAAALLMALGVYLHLSEQHEHEHDHEPMEHEHRHVHDAHHQHEHGPDDPPGEPHTHRHRHDRLRHSHPHHPDLHHRHRHG